MIVNHEAKVLILGNRKCGSSALERHFNPVQSMPRERFKMAAPRVATHFDGRAFDSELIRVLRNTWPKHYNAYQWQRLLAFLGHDWDGYRKVVVIRNPWDRMLSEYMWYLKTRPDPVSQFTSREEFEYFLMRNRTLATNALAWFTGVFDGRYDEHGFLVVKLEGLAQAVPEISGLFGTRARALPDSAGGIEKLNATDRPRSYAAHYTSHARAAVGHLFASDIERGAYEF